ncbi:MAG: metal-sensitive transcriptional regulator [Sporichthyaceae bacterium]
MTTSGVLAPLRSRHLGQRHDAEILSRLNKAKGQLAGITSMYEDGRYCIDILDQLAAARAAIDAVGLILMQDHINACVRDAINHDDTDEKVTELVTAVRRFLRSR